MTGSLTALRFRDSPADLLPRPRAFGPEKPTLFGGVPFRPGDFRRLCGATDVGRASIMPCSIVPHYNRERGFVKGSRGFPASFGVFERIGPRFAASGCES